MAKKAQEVSVEAVREPPASQTVHLAPLSDAVVTLLSDTVNGLDTPPVKDVLPALGGYGRHERSPYFDVDRPLLGDGRVPRFESFVDPIGRASFGPGFQSAVPGDRH